MCTVGNYHFSAGGIAFGKMVLPHQHKAGEFTVSACAGQECEVLHAGDCGQRSIQIVYHFLRAFHRFCGLQRMEACEQGMSGNLFVDLGIIFHCAGPKRIESGVHTEVHLAEVRVVAYHINFTHLRQI